MKCKTCGEQMVQKSRLRLSVVGLLMLLSPAIAFRFAWFWAPGIILFLTGAYLLVWATLGNACWCRNCKKFNLF
jgi:hypothetical protein